MKEQFVPYDLAIRLKELGFDEECFDYYIPNGKAISHIFNNSFELKKYNSETNHIYGDIELVSRPLWQQCWDWFRYKYGLEIDFTFHTNYLENGDNNVYEINVQNRNSGELYLLTPLNGFKTYQKAQLALLNKLIEIVEHENNIKN